MADAEVIVAGAGPGGLMTALGLARRGLRVVVIEKKPPEKIGRAIRVSIEERIFAETGLAPPQPPERLAAPAAREFISPDNKHKLNLRSAPVVRVELRAFATRLVELAEAAGVHFLFETEVTGPLLDGDRVTGVVGTTADGRLFELSAPLSVDASGIAGVLRFGLPEEMGLERQIDPHDVVNAWQESREIDRASVMDLLSRNRIRPQVEVLRLGFMGPFSLFGVYVDLDDDRVEITVGVLHDPRFHPARDLVARYVEAHSWIGEPIARGGGLIPIRRPLDSMVADGLACVGDAGFMAIPQHASGVASALLAGKILAEVAAAALEAGDTSRRGLWPYNVRYMEARGLAQANSDLYRRFILGLSSDELSALFACGLITEEGVRGSLEGMPLELPTSVVMGAVWKLLPRPRLLYRLARLARDTQKALRLYSAYPRDDDPQTFARWRREAERLFNKWVPAPATGSPDDRELTEYSDPSQNLP